MSARRLIITALSEDSHGGIATLSDVDHAEHLVNAYRAEVRREDAARLLDQRRQHISRAIFRDGITHAAGLLNRWADENPAAATPEVIAADEQAYDDELAMLRGLVRTLRVAARQDDLPAVQQALIHHASDDAEAREKSSRKTADATPTPALNTRKDGRS